MASCASSLRRRADTGGARIAARAHLRAGLEVASPTRIALGPRPCRASNAPREVSAAESLATAGMQRGTLLTVREQGDGSAEDETLAPPPPPRATDAVTHERFN